MTTPKPHLEQSLQRDIDRLKSKIGEMSALCEVALKSCIKALAEQNRQLAFAIILRDQYIDELEKEIDRLCLEFLVRQQPVAGLLRFAYSTIKVNLELERVGDYAESMARQTLKLIGKNLPIPLEEFKEMADMAIPMFHDAVQAFLEQNGELAAKTIQIEEAIDLRKRHLNEKLVEMFRKEQIPYEVLNALIMINRRWERVSDQARNICMETLYMCTGEFAKHPGAEAFRILFVDEYNACRSLMAEAIANSLNLPRFVFASAGLTPKPIEPKTIEFMKSKGHDISRAVPKSVIQVPNLDHYNVIVALSPEVRKAFPQRPRKAVFLDWSIEDPSRVDGSAAQILEAYEQAYAFIKSHIIDLVNAVVNLNAKETN